MTPVTSPATIEVYRLSFEDASYDDSGEISSDCSAKQEAPASSPLSLGVNVDAINLGPAGDEARSWTSSTTSVARITNHAAM